MPAPRLVRIPRHLLHAGLDDLPAHGVPERARAALGGLLADLPAVPDASHSAVLVGPPGITLPCLVVLARHLVQGLRDHNVALMREPARLRAERLKLAFLAGDDLASLLAGGDRRVCQEEVLCVAGSTPALAGLLADREAAGRASFVTTSAPRLTPGHWRRVDLAA